MKNYLLALFFFVMAGCGSSPSSAPQDQAQFDRLSTKIDGLQWKLCEEKDLKFCFDLKIDLQLMDRIERSLIAQQNFDFELRDLSDEILAFGKTRSTKQGELELKARILLPQERRFSNLPLRLLIQNESYGRLRFDFTIDFLDASDQSESFKISNDDNLMTISNHELRNFEIEVTEQKILNVSSISKHEETVSFLIQAKLVDEQTLRGVPWTEIQIKITDSLSQQDFIQAKRTDGDGIFDFRFALTRFRFSHESQKKIRVDIFFESQTFKNQFTQYWIIDLEPDSNVFIESRMTPDEVMQNDFWRDRARRYASQTPPQIFLNKMAIVEIPLKEAWRLSKDIQLIRDEKLIFDFNLLLERAGFRGLRSRSLASQKVSVRLGLTETEIENFTPRTWTEIQTYEVRSEQNDDYTLGYLKENHLSPEVNPSQAWFLMETSLVDFPLIAPSYHLIRWPNLYFRNLPQTRLAFSARKTDEQNQRQDFPAFEMNWRPNQPPHKDSLSIWLENGDASHFKLSAKESLELLTWMKNQALNAGHEVQTAKPWHVLRSFKVTDITDQSLLSEEELGQEQKQLRFAIRTQGYPCISFACDDQIMSMCSEKSFELDSEVSFFVENLSENLAHRMLNPNEISNKSQHSWLMKSFLFFELHSGLKFR